MAFGFKHIFPRLARATGGWSALHTGDFFSRVLEEHSVPTFAIGSDRRVLIWNKACAELTGLAAEKVIGKPDHWRGFYPAPRPCLADLVLEDAASESARLYAASRVKGTREAGLAAENWLDLPCGKRVYIIIDAYPIYGPRGELVAVIETLRDVTAEKNAASQAELIRKKAEEEEAIAAAERQKAITLAGEGLSRLAKKDLSCRLGEEMPPAFHKLRADFNAAMDQLSAALASVVKTSSSITTGAEEMSSAARDLAERTEQQAHGLDKTKSSLNEITALLLNTAQDASTAHDMVKDAIDNARKGGNVVGRAVSAMEEIEQSSQQISEIIGVIDEIAVQTNLLSLNAGIEAARAGSAGHGFAVVASETRALAQRSSDAARQIKSLIALSADHVRAGGKLVSESGSAFQQILVSVAGIETAVASIADRAASQAETLRQIETAVQRMSDHTNQNAAAAQQASAVSSEFINQALSLSETMAEFRQAAKSVSREPARPAAAPPVVPAANASRLAAAFGRARHAGG
jgi:methyl-accepting chemotaxis protein